MSRVLAPYDWVTLSMVWTSTSIGIPSSSTASGDNFEVCELFDLVDHFLAATTKLVNGLPNRDM